MATQLKQYTILEEIFNAVSHGIGALLSVAALTLLVFQASLSEDIARIASFSIYGASLVILFLASTLYHALHHERAKRLFKLLDHCAIYLLIAGTYTPLMLVTLQGQVGYTMLVVIWLVAVGGIAFKLFFGYRYQLFSLLTYLGMGGLSLAIINNLYQQLPFGGLVLLAVGGGIYALGTIFYSRKTIPYNHAIWHLFVLGGAACHFFMMWFYV